MRSGKRSSHSHQRPSVSEIDILSVVEGFVTSLLQTNKVSYLLSPNVVLLMVGQMIKGREEVVKVLSRLSGDIKKLRFSSPEVFGRTAGMWCSAVFVGKRGTTALWIELSINAAMIDQIFMEWLWSDAQIGDGVGTGVRIITYHRFDQPGAAAQLRRQCLELRARYHILSLDEAYAVLQDRTVLDKPGVIVTVDDGHRDFYLVAAPVFHKFNIPAMCYLVTDFLDGTGWLWFDVVDYVLNHTSLGVCRGDSFLGKEGIWPLETGLDRIACANDVKQMLKSVPDQERQTVIATLPCALQVQLPIKPSPDYEPLQWAEVRELTAKGFHFGVHTRSHPILAQVEDRGRLVNEIVGAKLRIEEELDRGARHFAYPNGQRADINESCLNVVASAGFLTGVTTVPGVNRPESDMLQLRRIWVEPDQSRRIFGKRVSGAPAGAAWWAISELT